MRRRSIGLAVLAIGSSFAAASMLPQPQPPTTTIDITASVREPDEKPLADRPLVQIALLLDTSNSMDGLINQARTQLWAIVNEIGRAKRNGQVPRLQVALIEYGNDNLVSGEGFVRTVLPFTDNLDDVSEKLFALSTNGGSEFCGKAIQQAGGTLDWSAKATDYKAIFIAGNEPFGQGTVDYRESIASTIGRGIVVNTIHCGERRIGVESGWAEGAKLGEGAFSNIDPNRVVEFRRCAQDDEIERLSIEINVTYVPYGVEGKAAADRQEAQDNNAAANASVGSSVQRAAAKAGSNYDNGSWDLVDAVESGKVDLAKIDDEKLPEGMRTMNLDERKAHVAAQSKKRAEIRSRINTLVAEREKARAAPTTQPGGNATLDAAIVESVREQLKGREYQVE